MAITQITQISARILVAASNSFSGGVPSQCSPGTCMPYPWELPSTLGTLTQTDRARPHAELPVRAKTDSLPFEIFVIAANNVSGQWHNMTARVMRELNLAGLQLT